MPGTQGRCMCPVRVLDKDFGWQQSSGLIDGDGCLSFNGNVCRCEIILDAKDVQTYIKSRVS